LGASPFVPGASGWLGVAVGDAWGNGAASGWPLGAASSRSSESELTAV
jgi:hypothetical protein